MKDKKVVLTYYDLENNIAEETLWIKSINSTEYQIENIPFYAPNVAFNDIITVESDDDVLYYDETIRTSEHSTIQIVVFKDDFIEDIIKNIELLGCSWEGMENQKILAVDVPSNLNYTKLKEYLENQLINNVLDYKEACLSETHNNQIE